MATPTKAPTPSAPRGDVPRVREVPQQQSAKTPNRDLAAQGRVGGDQSTKSGNNGDKRVVISQNERGASGRPEAPKYPEVKIPANATRGTDSPDIKTTRPTSNQGSDTPAASKVQGEGLVTGKVDKPQTPQKETAGKELVLARDAQRGTPGDQQTPGAGDKKTTGTTGDQQAPGNQTADQAKKTTGTTGDQQTPGAGDKKTTGTTGDQQTSGNQTTDQAKNTSDQQSATGDKAKNGDQSQTRERSTPEGFHVTEHANGQQSLQTPGDLKVNGSKDGISEVKLPDGKTISDGKPISAVAFQEANGQGKVGILYQDGSQKVVDYQTNGTRSAQAALGDQSSFEQKARENSRTSGYGDGTQGSRNNGSSDRQTSTQTQGSDTQNSGNDSNRYHHYVNYLRTWSSNYGERRQGTDTNRGSSTPMERLASVVMRSQVDSWLGLNGKKGALGWAATIAAALGDTNADPTPRRAEWERPQTSSAVDDDSGTSTSTGEVSEVRPIEGGSETPAITSGKEARAEITKAPERPAVGSGGNQKAISAGSDASKQHTALPAREGKRPLAITSGK